MKRLQINLNHFNLLIHKVTLSLTHISRLYRNSLLLVIYDFVLSHYSNGWVDCWSVPIVALCINYIYHPMPPLGPPPQADITTPEKEEILLSPMRIPRCRKSPGIHFAQVYISLL